MKPNTLIVSEVFYSLQGEGSTVGVPAVFLRLSGCNLMCEGAGWRCDTIEVWQKGRSTEFENVLSDYQFKALKRGAHLIITGGEPLLHEAAINRYLDWFINKYEFLPFIEVETNGTIIPGGSIINRVRMWNCSPKLPNSGESFAKRVNEVAILYIQDMTMDHIFKFVINKRGDLMDLFDDYKFIDFERKNKIYLMPAGATQKELAVIRPIVAELCKDFGFNYTDRMHISIWNKKTGV